MLFILESFLAYFISVLLPSHMLINYIFSDFFLILLFVSTQYILFKNKYLNWTSIFILYLILNSFAGLIATALVFSNGVVFTNNEIAPIVVPFIFQACTLITFYYLAQYIKDKLIAQNIIITKKILYILICPVFLQYFIYDFYFVYQTKEYLILFILSIFTTITVIITLYRQLKAYEESTQNYIFTNLLKSSKEQMNQMIENEEALKGLRHDLKNHLIVMQGLLKEDNTMKLKEYLHEITPMFDIHQPKIYCKNIYLNTLFNNRIAEYKEITFHISIHPNFCSHFSDVDLYILISNLLDNSIQELETYTSLDQKIEISLDEKKGFQILNIRNPLSHIKTLSTEKPDINNHGIGLSIIKKIVRKYDGEMQINQNTYFEVKILFCLNYPNK